MIQNIGKYVLKNRIIYVLKKEQKVLKNKVR